MLTCWTIFRQASGCAGATFFGVGEDGVVEEDSDSTGRDGHAGLLEARRSWGVAGCAVFC